MARTQNLNTIERRMQAVLNRSGMAHILSASEHSALAVIVNEILPDYRLFLQKLDQISRMTKEGECLACGKDGSQPNPDCPDHEPWIASEQEDHKLTLMGLIDDARYVVANRKVVR